MNPWQQVLHYWFGDQTPPSSAHRQRWFSGGEATDKDIRQRFASLHDQLSAGLPDNWPQNGEAVCAAIIVLDQFSRNLFRGTAQAFAFDDAACELAVAGWQQQRFDHLPPHWQAFCLMPLMHSESLKLHEQCLQLLKQLCQQHPDDTILTAFYSSAQTHHDIIAQFGRYPHRNQVLGRPSTQAEHQYLTDGAQRFGQ